MKIGLIGKIENSLSPERVKAILFYGCLILVCFGLMQKLKHIPSGSPFAALGLLGVLIFFTAKAIKTARQKTVPLKITFLHVLLILMTITIFSKYYHHAFWDYPAYVILPVFIVSAIILIIKRNITDQKTIITSILFLILRRFLIFHPLQAHENLSRFTIALISAIRLRIVFRQTGLNTQ